MCLRVLFDHRRTRRSNGRVLGPTKIKESRRDYETFAVYFSFTEFKEGLKNVVKTSVQINGYALRLMDYSLHSGADLLDFKQI